MYCELLAEAVRKLKDEPVESIPAAVIDLGFATYIPKNYIPVNRHRMDVYRKIAVAKGDDDLQQIKGELTDVYGSMPDEVNLLLDLAELRIKASRNNIKSIVASGEDLIFTFSKDAEPPDKSFFSNVSGKVRISNMRTVYLRLSKNYFEPGTLITVLRKLFGEDQK
jgi:transcription-repair coupling factor (superfamily II helicase)